MPDMHIFVLFIHWKHNILLFHDIAGSLDIKGFKGLEVCDSDSWQNREMLNWSVMKRKKHDFNRQKKSNSMFSKK